MMTSTPSPVLQLRLPLWRSRMMLAFVFAGFMALVARAVFLQAWDTCLLYTSDAAEKRIV